MRVVFIETVRRYDLNRAACVPEFEIRNPNCHIYNKNTRCEVFEVARPGVFLGACGLPTEGGVHRGEAGVQGWNVIRAHSTKTNALDQNRLSQAHCHHSTFGKVGNKDHLCTDYNFLST